MAQSSIERHIVTHLTALLDDEHALRRLTNLVGASQLTALFDAARLRRLELEHPATRDETFRALIASVAYEASNSRLAA